MYELARRLPDADLRVLAPAAPGDTEFDRSAGMHVRRLSPLLHGQAPWLASLTAHTLRLAVQWRPDVIVCGHVVTAPAAVLAKRLFGIPYVLFTYAWEIRRRRRRQLVGRLLREATLVTAISRFTEASVLQYGLSRNRVRMLHPGTDPVIFTPSGNGRAVGGPRRIVTVSRVDELYKGHDTVIRSLPLVRAKCGDVRYTVAGDGRLRPYLTRLAQSLGVADAVVFAGRVADAELPALYRSADVIVQMSREARSGGGAEGYGIVCLEAAASGKPVIAGRSGGLPDAVVDGVTGLLIDPEDDAAVADAIVRVLSDAALADRLGRAGRERVVRELTWDHMATRARAIFGEAAAMRR
jgi:phosphatidylinositol alpha-1,6-mannosyltransferase